jgi:hypothetical protein
MASHVWRFFRSGGFDQVRLDRGADFAALKTLDQKLWVALSCPVKGLEFDAPTLALLDSDGDGHIRAPELLAAIDFVTARLDNLDLLVDPPAALPRSDLRQDSPEGKAARAAAGRVLEALGKGDADRISLDDLADRGRIFGQTGFNGDGVITAASVAGEAHQALLADIVAVAGGTADRSGKTGVNAEAIAAYFKAAREVDAWRRCRPTGLAIADADLEGALAALAAVAAKVDDYFTRCRLIAFDDKAAGPLNGAEADFLALARDNLATPDARVAALPLALAGKDKPLPLGPGVNPAWAAALAEFTCRVARPVLGAREALTADEWRQIRSTLAEAAAWAAARPATPLADTDVARLQAIAEGSDEAALLELVAQDAALADDFAAVEALEKLLRLVAHLGEFANNFVAFKTFYASDAAASFQIGTLYLDGRSCDLCVPVADAGKHAALAGLSRLYLVYVDCVRGGEKMTVAAAMTAGDSDQLMVGRNGVFYDRQGRDWDATITKLVDHPISLRQAFWSPYRKMARMIGEQFQKFAAAKAQNQEAQAQAAIASGAGKVESAAAGAAAAKPAPFDVGKFAGIFAAIGLAVGAIGTAIAAVVTGFLGLKAWQMPIAILGIMLLISGPAILLAWFKLRARTLGPLLDANGWAVNTRALINIPFGTSLTRIAQLPPGSERALADPYAQKGTPWGRILLVLVAIAAGVWYWLTQMA